MPRKRELTYFAPRRRWKKKIQGKVRYFGEPCNKTDDAGYRKAVAEYRELMEQQQASQDAEAERQRIRQLPTHNVVEKADPHNIAAVMQMVASHQPEAVTITVPRRAGVSVGYKSEQPLSFAHRPAAKGGTIGDHVDHWLTDYARLAKLGERSMGRYAAYRRDLLAFKTQHGEKPVEAITAQLMKEIHGALQECVINGELSANTAHDRMGAIKLFVRTLWEDEVIELPRNLRRGRLTIKVPQQKVNTYDLADLQVVLGECSEKTRLYLLLMLNTGATQKDVSDLQPDEVDWKRGAITRRRSKAESGNYANAPEVTWVLWRETFALLKKQGRRQGDRVLTNEVGGELVREWLDDQGEVKKVDNIRTAYARVLKKMNRRFKKDHPKHEGNRYRQSLKTLRATSANLLKQNERFQTLYGTFLGHSPTSVADRNYTAPPQKLLDEGVRWLASHYGLDKKPPAKPANASRGG